jgi:hypothetical protein
VRGIALAPPPGDSKLNLRALPTPEVEVVADLMDLSYPTPQALDPLIERLDQDRRAEGQEGAPQVPGAQLPFDPKRYRRAYLCYASADRAEALKTSQALTAAGIEFFIDSTSLAAGQNWRAQIEQQIADCDLFLLFWSTRAAQSREVIQEAEYALARQKASGRPDIVPLVLEGPPVPPPPSLAEIHFNDPLRYLIQADAGQGSAKQNAEAWITLARPILSGINALINSMNDNQDETPRDSEPFERELRAMIASLPELPDPVDRPAIESELNHHLAEVINHGRPIPDEYTFRPTFPEPGSLWGSPPQQVKRCLRPGLEASERQREMYGGLSKGVLVEPVVEYADEGRSA